VKERLQRYPATKEFLLDMLHDLQDAEPKNYLTPEALQAVAEYLSIPLSDVVSTATFYTMYSLNPRGRHIIRLCESPPCQLVGAESLLEILSQHLAVGVGGTTEDGAFTLETASCLGVCGVAPAMMIDEELYGNLTASRVVEVIEGVRRRDATG
jgi:NADH-quinone oxidoreductase subunit E